MRIGIGLVVLLGLATAPCAQASYIPCEKAYFPDPDAPGNFLQPWKPAPKLTAKDVPNVAALIKAADKPIAVEGADFRGQSFAGVKLANVCFYDTDLRDTDWTRAELYGVVFSQSKLNKAKFARSSATGVKFFDSVLDDVDASGIAMTDTSIEGGSFDGLNLRRATLTKVTLFCGLLSGEHECGWPENKGVDVSGAMLIGGEWDVISTERWNFAGAVLDDWAVQLGQLPQFSAALIKTKIRIGSSGYGSGTYSTLSKSEWRSLVGALVGGGETQNPSASSAGTGWFKPGTTLIYAQDLSVRAAWKNTATYRKLLPVILASSDSTVFVHVVDKRTISVGGGAMGGNGHSCGVDGEFRYNAKTGWFGAPHSADWKKDFPSAPAFEDVIRLSPTEAEVEFAHPAENYPEYVSCGARASFLGMRRLNVPQSMVAELSRLQHQ